MRLLNDGRELPEDHTFSSKRTGYPQVSRNIANTVRTSIDVAARGDICKDGPQDASGSHLSGAGKGHRSAVVRRMPPARIWVVRGRAIMWNIPQGVLCAHPTVLSALDGCNV